MDVNDFLRLVREELDLIKANATKEEISRLDFDTFNYENRGQCIYGQMTGNCFSKRASEIMGKKISTLDTDLPKNNPNFNFDHFDPDKSLGVPLRYTYLEQYLFWSSSLVHSKIISYLKGEIDDIALEL